MQGPSSENGEESRHQAAEEQNPKHLLELAIQVNGIELATKIKGFLQDKEDRLTTEREPSKGEAA